MQNATEIWRHKLRKKCFMPNFVRFAMFQKLSIHQCWWKVPYVCSSPMNAMNFREKAYSFKSVFFKTNPETFRGGLIWRRMQKRTTWTATGLWNVLRKFINKNLVYLPTTFEISFLLKIKMKKFFGIVLALPICLPCWLLELYKTT